MNQREFVFCPYCGGRLVKKERFRQLRATCSACDYVHFRDPKVAVIGLVTWQEHLLLIRRGVEPMRGRWALPGGYMDAGEMPQGALARELREEVGMEVEVGELLDVFPMVSQQQTATGIVLAYRAAPTAVPASGAPLLVSDDDVLEAGWFGSGEVPADLAFESTVTLVAAWREALGWSSSRAR